MPWIAVRLIALLITTTLPMWGVSSPSANRLNGIAEEKIGGTDNSPGLAVGGDETLFYNWIGYRDEFDWQPSDGWINHSVLSWQQAFSLGEKHPQWAFLLETGSAVSDPGSAGGNTVSGWDDTTIRLSKALWHIPNFRVAAQLEALINSATDPSFGDNMTTLSPGIAYSWNTGPIVSVYGLASYEASLDTAPGTDNVSDFELETGVYANLPLNTFIGMEHIVTISFLDNDPDNHSFTPYVGWCFGPQQEWVTSFSVEVETDDPDNPSAYLELTWFY